MLHLNNLFKDKNYDKCKFMQKKNAFKNYKTVYKHLMKINMKSCHHFFSNT